MEEADGHLKKVKERGNSTCPTCSRVFPLEEIEMHADLCADSWTDPVGELYKDGQSA